jgi:regulation of enolase protein 1 (concanavalin A-like superfamily)
MLVALAAPPQVPTASKWTTLVSKEGNFIVDFPKKPTVNRTQTVRGPRGRAKVVMIECDTPDVLYVAQKIEVSQATGLKPKEIDEILDAQRDSIAAGYKGRVLTQKKVMLDDGSVGRDFTIEGRPEKAGGALATVRVREYFGQKAMYILIAATAADRELPEDVGRFFGSFTIGTKRTKKAGPHPEPEGKPLGAWGDAVDPDGDCTFDDQGHALAISVPGTLHDLNADIDKFNAPRVVREVSGDFSVTVKVVGEFKPGPKSHNPKSVPYNGGGIFVWQDSDNYIRLERGAVIRRNKVGTFAIFEEREWGARGAVNNGKLDPGTAYLRLQRRGNRILGYTSKDGKNWARLDPIETSWGPKLKVGLDAVNSGNEPFQVRFENFEFSEGRGKGS